jgi:hypothetical protein
LGEVPARPMPMHDPSRRPRRRLSVVATWEIHQVVGEGDTVVVYATHHARHTGELMGIAPTGHEVAYDYVHIVRFRDGKVVDHWGVRDDLTLMRQLGVLPPPAVPVGSGRP